MTPSIARNKNTSYLLPIIVDFVVKTSIDENGSEVLRILSTGNVGIGDNVLKANTTDLNTAVGWGALTANTTGTQNVSVGGNSMLSNTTASNTTAIGYRALFANTTGASNTAVGHNSLDANTTGQQNVATGYLALTTNTTGSYNNAFGVGALNDNTTANANTAIGHTAFYSNNTGSDGVAVGYQAAYSNTTGIRNTAVGLNALYANTTGSNNTAIGNGAGDNITTGNNNIVIGRNVDAPSATGNDQLNIGNSLIGKVDGSLIGFGRGSAGFARKHVVLSGGVTISDNTWTTVAYLGHTHSGICTVHVLDSGDYGGIVGGMTTAYGATDKDTISVVTNGLTSIDYRYSNSGYVLQIQIDTPDNASRQVDWSWSGISSNEIYVTS